MRLLVEKSGLAAPNGVIRAILTLVGGTAAAQAIALLALPVLTRIYSPSDFEVLAIYVAILAILAPTACARYDIAISIPENHETAANLLMLSSAVALVVGAISGLILAVAGDRIAGIFGASNFTTNFWLVPLGIGATGLYLAVQGWATRRRWFAAIARTRATQAIGGVTTSLAMGAFIAGPLGLLMGHLINASAGVLRLAHAAWQEDRDLLKKTTAAGMKSAAYEFRRMPTYSVLETLANNGGIQLPVILIASIAIGPEAGFVLLAMRAVGTPVALIGGAASQVYLGHAAEHLRLGTIGSFTKQILANLAKVGVGPLILIGIVAPTLFPIVFGGEWARAGELVRWMTAWSIARLLSFPISMIMHLRMAQRAMLAVTALGFLLRVGAVVIAGNGGLIGAAEAYAVSSAVFYSICYVAYCKYADLVWRDHVYILRSAVPLALLCGVVGAIAVSVVESIKL